MQIIDFLFITLPSTGKEVTRSFKSFYFKAVISPRKYKFGNRGICSFLPAGALFVAGAEQVEFRERKLQSSLGQDAVNPERK